MALPKSTLILRNKQLEVAMNSIRYAVGARKAEPIIEVVSLARGNYLKDRAVPTKQFINNLYKARDLINNEGYETKGEIAYRLYKNTNSGKWIDNWKGEKWDEERKGLAMLEQFKIRPEDDSGFNEPPWADTKQLTAEEREELFKYHGEIDDTKEQAKNQRYLSYKQARRIVDKGHTKAEKRQIDKIFKKLSTLQKNKRKK